MKLDAAALNGINIEDLIKAELIIHPECKLVDIYKIILQAFFGPLHILNDLTTVSSFIKSETLAMNTSYHPLLQELGNNHGFSRISISILQPFIHQGDELFTELCNQMANLMKISCLQRKPSYSMKELWIESKKLIHSHFLIDCNEWDELLIVAEQSIIPHHSELFRTAYDPHYRVLNPNLNSLINNLLNKPETF
ncbi:MAG: hypothetical protein PHY48_02875 [Candidatus Cloacimonetes bacterium]|nr:hypothetical protein [Candidatus Cloacimonadota bacterium]